MPAESPRRSHLERPHLDTLASEAIHVLREVAAQFERAALLFSGGKDSTVLAHLARQAFWPAPPPFQLLHVDTGHNFPETLVFRDELAESTGATLVVRTVADSIARGRCRDESGPWASRNALQTVTLLDAIAELRLDAAIGGGRRDEEKARAKERVFSHRDAHGQWHPKQQRPELWDLYDGTKHPGEHFRVFPLSNWTELDVWRYIARERIAVPSLYFAHDRAVFARDDQWLAATPWVPLLPGEAPAVRRVRFRTVGDATCTGAVLSDAATVAEVIEEIARSRVSERGTRADDQRSEAAMEDRKRGGYF